jgi:hypothetical protein
LSINADLFLEVILFRIKFTNYPNLGPYHKTKDRGEQDILKINATSFMDDP